MTNNTTIFRDRIEAGVQLAQRLRKFQENESIVLAVPRGGVPVAYAVVTSLGLPLDIIFTKKIGHPLNSEYAIGAASLTEYFVVPHENVSETYILNEVKNIRQRLKEMYAKFMGDREPEDIKNKTVIVIDDGIATGNTILGTVNLLRKEKPKKIIIAAPVASKNAVQKLSKFVDEIVTVFIPEEFYGVGAFYQNFEPVSDSEVMMYMEGLKKLKASA